MPERRYRTKGYKRRAVRTTGGRTVWHYKGARSGPAKCASCGRVLSGVPRLRGNAMRSLPRSSRMPNRPFGGYLCPACARRSIKAMART
ncbi:MAG TPA: 50S ribosomal protein L34e [Hadesarchaea archaeon]|nr:50S ribosomal protein L34e [Hadesarchaea archaeon]